MKAKLIKPIKIWHNTKNVIIMIPISTINHVAVEMSEGGIVVDEVRMINKLISILKDKRDADTGRTPLEQNIEDSLQEIIDYEPEIISLSTDT